MNQIAIDEYLERYEARMKYDRIFCQYEVYQDDNLLLRIVKYVCRLLAARTRNLESRKALSEIFSILDTIADIPCCYKDTLKVKLNYYQRDFQIILDYCKMFLSFRMADGSSGEYGLDYVLINSAALFENFMGQFLDTHLNGWDVKLKATSYMAKDVQGDLFRYENDFLLTNKISHEIVIGDTKYKMIDLMDRLNHYGVSHGDLYQMISYAVRRGAHFVLLLYPGLCSDEIGMRSFFIRDEFSNKEISFFAVKVPLDTVSAEVMARNVLEVLDLKIHRNVNTAE